MSYTINYINHSIYIYIHFNIPESMCHAVHMQVWTVPCVSYVSQYCISECMGCMDPHPIQTKVSQMPHHDRQSGQPWPKTYPKRYANAMRMLCGVLTISSQKCIHPTLDPGWKNSQITKGNQSSNAISGMGEPRC